MRSEGPGQECLLADYQELRKIKRHTRTRPYLVSVHAFPPRDWSGCRAALSKGFYLGRKEKRPRRAGAGKVEEKAAVLRLAAVI